MKTLFDLLSTAKEKFGDMVFVKEKAGDGVSEKTFGQFCGDAFRISAFLKDKFGKTIHTATIGPTSYYYLVSHIGSMIGGNTGVPIDAQLAPADVAELLDRADVEVLFFDKRFAAALPTFKAN